MNGSAYVPGQPASFSAEMKAEIDRVTSLWQRPLDFGIPPNDDQRKIDQAIHAVWNIHMPNVTDVRRLKIPGRAELDASPCDAVLYRPIARAAGTILYIHGGGWCYCNLETHERFMRSLANASGVDVLGVHYRLAPENPYPAALNDVVSAYRTLEGSPESIGLTGGPVVIAGDSAGANLALALMLHEIDRERSLPAGALLFYGAYGLNFSTSSYRLYGADGYLLTENQMRQFWHWYLPDEKNRIDPLAVPALASDNQLRSLPPLFMLAAELDPLAFDTLELKSRLDSLGRSDSLHLEKGVVHGFLQMTATVAAARAATTIAAKEARRFLAELHQEK